MPKIEVTPIYAANRNARAKVIVNQGGARSSKSYSLAQLFIQDFVNLKNQKFLITRKTLPSLRITAYKLFKDLLTEYGYGNLVTHNKTERTFEYVANNNWLLFTSVDNPEKIRSTEFNKIWMEEANEFTYDDFITLKLRLSGAESKQERNRIFLSFNPSDAQGWINKRLFKTETDIEIIRSTWLDNPFLSEYYIKALKELQSQDENYYRIYALGEFGLLLEQIYRPFKMEHEWPQDSWFEDTCYGLDFGFNNPSALVRIDIKDREVWLTEGLHKTGLTNADLISELESIIQDKAKPLYADPSEPARIEEIHRAGFNIHPADNSVMDGIDFCKRLVIHTNPGNVNLNEEAERYVWRKDREGNILDEPVKFLDHLMDAMRYAIYSHIGKYIEEFTFADILRADDPTLDSLMARR